jgi:hypothetical protein
MPFLVRIRLIYTSGNLELKVVGIGKAALFRNKVRFYSESSVKRITNMIRF